LTTSPWMNRTANQCVYSNLTATVADGKKHQSSKPHLKTKVLLSYYKLSN